MRELFKTEQEKYRILSFDKMRHFPLRVLTETPHFWGLNDRHLTKTPLSQRHKKNPTPYRGEISRNQDYIYGCNLIAISARLQSYFFYCTL